MQEKLCANGVHVVTVYDKDYLNDVMDCVAKRTREIQEAEHAVERLTSQLLDIGVMCKGLSQQTIVLTGEQIDNLFYGGYIQHRGIDECMPPIKLYGLELVRER